MTSMGPDHWGVRTFLKRAEAYLIHSYPPAPSLYKPDQSKMASVWPSGPSRLSVEISLIVRVNHPDDRGLARNFGFAYYNSRTELRAPARPYEFIPFLPLPHTTTYYSNIGIKDAANPCVIYYQLLLLLLLLLLRLLVCFDMDVMSSHRTNGTKSSMMEN